ncbi:MAG: hypothetical protein Kow00127_17620 [Bacteroidales bacterium]
MIENEISNRFIGIAIEVRRAWDPGLPESAYKECLNYKFAINNVGI